jgi:hypothetical protein
VTSSWTNAVDCEKNPTDFSNIAVQVVRNRSMIIHDDLATAECGACETACAIKAKGCGKCPVIFVSSLIQYEADDLTQHIITSLIRQVAQLVDLPLDGTVRKNPIRSHPRMKIQTLWIRGYRGHQAPPDR